MKISIHAPIVGCDQQCSPAPNRLDDFNPRTHRGVRLLFSQDLMTSYVFQSTHPSWGATISIAPYVEYDRFQSTHPSWGATIQAFKDGQLTNISIHAPIVGCDCIYCKGRTHRYYFNPRTHRGVRLPSDFWSYLIST